MEEDEGGEEGGEMGRRRRELDVEREQKVKQYKENPHPTL